jgi:hypothetical protein
VKDALDSLKSAIGKVEAKRDLSLQEKLAKLSPTQPDLYQQCEKLSRPDDLPYAERDLVQLQVLEFVALKGLKPSKEQVPESKLGSSTRRHWEAEELAQTLSAFGDAPQARRSVPVLWEHLVRKYSDDPTFLERCHRDIEYLRRRLSKEDFTKPIPEYQGRGDNVDRQKAHHAFLNRLAQSVPLPKGLSREPLESLKRVEELLAKEKVRRKQEFESEFSRRLAGLKAGDEKLYDEYSKLQLAAQEHDDRAEGARKRVKLLHWLVDHPDARPHSGPKHDPHYTEVWEFLQVTVRYRGDPTLWEVIPGMGEYLLKKYPDAKYLTSQLKLHMQSIEELRHDGTERAAKRWAEEAGRNGELQASKEVKELFAKAAAAGKKLK